MSGNIKFIASFANQNGKQYLSSLQKEAQSLKRFFEQAKCSNQLILVENTTINSIINAFIDTKDRVGIFHYAGHADEETLHLEDSIANASGLANLIKKQACLPLVFLNGCATQPQVKFFKDAGAAAVISTETKVNDGAASAFAERFYESFLIKSRSIENSFEDAKNYLLTNKIFEKNEHNFSVSRNVRDAISTETDEESDNIQSWVLKVFDNSVLQVTLETIGAFIDRRLLVKPYCNWLVSQHSRIKMNGLRGITEIDLDQVFVSLRGELSQTYEILQSQKQLKEETDALERKFAEQNLSLRDRQKEKSKLLGRSAIMPTIEERDQRLKINKSKSGQLNLVEAFSAYDKLVILGDPGTGKTTLARWLVLMFTQEILKNGINSNVKVPKNKYIPDASYTFSNDTGSLGFARLPVLIRVSEYAYELKINKNSSVRSFLGNQTWLGNHPTIEGKGGVAQIIDVETLQNLIYDFVLKGEALIIFDGLDEIIEEEERKIVVERISQFIKEDIDLPIRLNLKQRNKIIVTSRIAGYHANPLNIENVYHVTIQPMESQAIEEFCNTWMLATQKLLQSDQKKSLEIEYDSKMLARQLISLIFAPNKQGTLELAGNPLLLTEISKIFLLEDRKLPDTRVDLYEKTTRNMLDVWRNRVKHYESGDLKIFEEKIFYVLEDIAEYIHENYATGLISSEEIEDIVGKSIDEFYFENPNTKTLKNTTKKIEKELLLKALNEEVGILAARAANLFGFLHLTFEEFFAARKLLRDPSKITERIISKAYQPRWREPLMLAISYLGTKLPKKEDRKQTLRALLDTEDPMGNIIPRSASLIALAIPEMNYVPEEDLIRDIVVKLLEAYASRGYSQESESLRNNVEDTFKFLMKNTEVWRQVRSDIVHILENDKAGAEIKNGVAHLLAVLGINDQYIVEPLLKCIKIDSMQWQWPVHQSLFKIAAKNPEWIGFKDLKMRKYLAQFNEVLQSINESIDWTKIIVLIYGGLKSVHENNNTIYQISHDTIINDSFLSDQIFDLLEDQKSPSYLLPFCEKYIQNKNNPVENRVDTYLVIAALRNDLNTFFSAIWEQDEDALIYALRNRVDRLMLISQPALATMIKNTNSVLGNILGQYEPDRLQGMLVALFKLDIEYNKQKSNPIAWVNAAPETLRALILAEIWVQPFHSDDPTYNMAVFLDTSGNELEKMGVETIVKSLSLIQQVAVLPPYNLWPVERTHYHPTKEEDILERCLVNLSLLDPSFDMLKAWALKSIKSMIEKHPDMIYICNFILIRMRSENYIPLALQALESFIDTKEQVDEDAFEENIVNSQNPLLLIHAANINILLLRTKLQQDQQLFFFNRDIKPEKKISILFEELSLLRSFSGSYKEMADKQMQFEKIINEIDNFSLEEDKVRCLIKLLSFTYDNTLQNQIINRSLLFIKKIKNPLYAAQCLNEIRPWINAHPTFQPEWSIIGNYLALDDDIKDVLNGHLYTYFTKISDLEGDKSQSITYTSLAAMLHDLNQIFSLPNDIDELWILLLEARHKRRTEIIERIKVKGRNSRLNLSINGALAINTLIDEGKYDWVLEILLYVQKPDPDAITVVTKWLNKLEFPDLAVYAAMLLLESKVLTEETFEYLETAMFQDNFTYQDQIRNRINLALNQPSFYASRIGIGTIIKIRKSLNNNYSERPYLARALAWFDEYLIHDDPNILDLLVEQAQKPGQKKQFALSALRAIHIITSKCAKKFIYHLKHGTTEVQQCLLGASIFILNDGYNFTKGNFEEELRRALFQKIVSPSKDIRLFATDAIGYLKKLTDDERSKLIQICNSEDIEQASVALISLGRADFVNSKEYIINKLNVTQLKDFAAEAISRYLIKTQGRNLHIFEVLNKDYGLDDDSILISLLNAAKDRWWGAYAQNCVFLLGAYFEKNPEIYAKFIHDAKLKLEFIHTVDVDFSYQSDIRWMRRAFHIDALAVGAERLPSTFLQHCRDIEASLVKITMSDKIFTNRMSALICLSLLRRMTKDCTRAFCTALKDISEVQLKAINVMFRFSEIDSNFVNEISDMMDDQSYSARYAMINMLAAVGGYAKTDSNLRSQILETLQMKLHHDDYRKPVFMLTKKISRNLQTDGTFNEIEEGNIVEYKGQLNHEIYKKILEVSGIRSLENQQL